MYRFITLKLYGRMKMFAMPTIKIPLRCHHLYVCMYVMYVCMGVNKVYLRPSLVESIHRSLLEDPSPQRSPLWPLLLLRGMYLYYTVCMYECMYVCMYARVNVCMRENVRMDILIKFYYSYTRYIIIYMYL